MTAARSSQLEFTVLEGKRQLTRCLLQPGEYMIGHDFKNDITVDDPSISSKHALLTMVSEDEIYLQDLQSINGTYVDDALAQEAVLITPASRIEIGGCTARLRVRPAYD
jgi:pSer/pThr/pTyr-binding forkhead associated (FHA) protein